MQEQGYGLKASEHCKRIHLNDQCHQFSGSIAWLGILQDAFEEFGVCSAKCIRKAQKIEKYY